MKSIFKNLSNFFEKAIILPVGKVILVISEKIVEVSRNFEKWLMHKTVLLFLSLILAVSIFILIDQKLLVFTESSAEVITDLEVDVIYNEEAYVIE